MKLIRVGIVGFDTSHAVEFTKRINHVDISEEQWVEGAQVVMGYPGAPTSFASEEVISQRTQLLRDKYGVQIVDAPDEMIGKVDAILLEFQEGDSHLENAQPFLKAGLPTFIDKPFTCSVRDARKLAKLAKSQGTPLFSSSSLRYALEIQQLKSRMEEVGAVLGADVYSPASLNPKNPGLFNYGIHGVETLYSLMGPGCESVWCVSEDRWETALGRWKDGRIGTMRGTRQGAHSYGFTAFCEKEVVPAVIDTRYIYRELLKQIVSMFQTRKPPIEIEETLEIVAFMEASLKSANRGGVKVKLRV
ncbi:MAG: Gfo/Idh/MocA family oxidoreductase [Candidatus Bathyarchaeia archaeon]